MGTWTRDGDYDFYKEDGKTLFALYGLSGRNTEGITVSGNVVTLTKANTGSSASITFINQYGEGYILALADDAKQKETKAAGFDGLAYKTASKSAGHILSADKKTVTYADASGGATLFVLTDSSVSKNDTTGITVDETTKTVTLTAANLNNQDVTFSANNGNYTFALASGISAPTTEGAGFNGNSYNAGTATKAGYKLSNDKKSVIFTAAGMDKTLFTLSGVKTTEGITVNGNVVTLTAANLDGKTVTFTENNDNYTFALASGISEPTTKAAGFDGNSYKAEGTSEGYKLSDDQKSVNYTAASGGNILFTLSGVKSTDGITVADKVVTLTAANLNSENVTFSANNDNYTFALASGIIEPQKTETASFDSKFSYRSAGTLDGYKLSDDTKTVNYVEATGDILFTLSGVKSTTGITVTDKVVTLTAANLNSENVTFSANNGDYTFALADGTEPKAEKESFDGLTYKMGGVQESGYALSNNKKSVTYVKIGESYTLFELSGVKSTDGIRVTDKVVTLTADNLDGKNISFSENNDDYIFELSGIGAPQTTGEGFDGFSYKSVAISAGYTLSSDKKSVSYTAASGGDTLFTLSGVENTNGINVNGNVVTLNAANLNKNNVTVDGGYTLALNDVASPTQTKAAGFDGTSYKSATFSEGYTASDNTITYTEPSGGDTLFTLTGVENTNGITVDETKKIVTLTAANLNKKNITVDGGYQLALGSDVAYQAGGAGGYYSLNSEKTAVTYNAAVVDTSKIVKGEAVTLTSGSENNFYARKFTKVNASSAESSVKIIGGNSASTLIGGAANDSVIGGKNNDKLYGNGGKDILSGGKGNDSMYGGAGNDKIYGGTGNDNLNGGVGNDLLIGGAGADKLYGNSGNDNLHGGTGNDSMYGGANDDKIYGNSGNDLLLGGEDNDSLYGGADNDKLYGNAGNDLLIGGVGDDSLWGGEGDDKLYGNAGDDFIYGGAGDDTLWGGAGNDKLWGNAGNDTFIYSGGKDTIYGFEDDDMLKITGKFSGTYNKKNKEVAFKVGSTANAITLKDFSATSINVNGTDYKISGSTLTKEK